MIVNIGDKTFKSKKKAEEYVRALLKEIGITDSVVRTTPHHVLFLLKLCQNHHRGSEKLQDMIDFVIKRNKMSKLALELYIKRTNGTLIDISWLKCVSGVPASDEHELKRAMRHSIEQQNDFLNNLTERKCSNCLQTECEFHVHHAVNEFDDLVKSFLKQTTLSIPKIFAENKCTNQTVFRVEDKIFSKEWQAYHAQHATLQLVCKMCNLSTLKKKRP
jgi:hypothetical protein